MRGSKSMSERFRSWFIKSSPLCWGARTCMVERFEYFLWRAKIS
jgi:hypothetical protein